MESFRNLWPFIVSVSSATAVVILFIFSSMASHKEKDHEALYKPRFKGDTVNMFIEEKFKEEHTDATERNNKLEAKLDKVLATVQTIKIDVEVLKAQREHSRENGVVR